MEIGSKLIRNKDTEGITSVVVALIAIAIIHMFVVIFQYQELGFFPVVGAFFLFTIIFIIGIFLLQFVLPLLGIAAAGGIAWAGYKANGWEGLLQSLLYVVVFIIVLVILAYVGPPVLSGYMVYLVYDTVFWGILVGVVVGIAWFVFITLAPWAVLGLFAGAVANKLTLIILGTLSFSYYKNEILSIGNDLNVNSFRSLYTLFVNIIEMLNLPWYMVIWCMILGILFRFSGKSVFG